MGQEPTPPPHVRLLDRALDSPAFIAAAATIGYFLVRVAFVARGDLEAAEALVRASGSLPVFVAVITGNAPILLLLVLFGLLVLWRRTRASDYTAMNIAILLVVGALLVTTPAVLLVAYVGGAALLGLIAWNHRRRKAPGDRDPAISDNVFRDSLVNLLLVAFVFGTFTSGAVWFPVERIQVRGRPATIGYVLTSDPRFFTVLEDRARKVTYLPSDQVEARMVCRLGGGRSRTIPDFLGIGSSFPSYPPCRAKGPRP